MNHAENSSAEPPAAKLSIRGVSKRFVSGKRTVQALDDVSIDVNEGEFVCLVGPSGCGKSTLLNIVAGLDRADSGEVSADGQPITAPGRDRMVMFQESALFPWLDVLGNVMFGLRLKPGLADAERRKVAEFYLQLVGLEKFHRAFVHELSGGMKQRVALARALAPNPRVLLMDEPFGALDALTREQLYGDIQRIWQQRKKTIVFVTHNVRESVRLGDRVLIMGTRPGRLKRDLAVNLARPRGANDRDVAEMSLVVERELRIEIEKVIREELDDAWTGANGALPRDPAGDLGDGI